LNISSSITIPVRTLLKQCEKMDCDRCSRLWREVSGTLVPSHVWRYKGVFIVQLRCSRCSDTLNWTPTPEVELLDPNPALHCINPELVRPVLAALTTGGITYGDYKAMQQKSDLAFLSNRHYLEVVALFGLAVHAVLLEGLQQAWVIVRARKAFSLGSMQCGAVADDAAYSKRTNTKGAGGTAQSAVLPVCDIQTQLLLLFIVLDRRNDPLFGIPAEMVKLGSEAHNLEAEDGADPILARALEARGNGYASFLLLIAGMNLKHFLGDGDIAALAQFLKNHPAVVKILCFLHRLRGMYRLIDAWAGVFTRSVAAQAKLPVPQLRADAAAAAAAAAASSSSSAAASSSTSASASASEVTSAPYDGTGARTAMENLNFAEAAAKKGRGRSSTFRTKSKNAKRCNCPPRPVAGAKAGTVCAGKVVDCRGIVKAKTANAIQTILTHAATLAPSRYVVTLPFFSSAPLPRPLRRVRVASFLTLYIVPSITLCLPS